jgi:endothelin-converting enzyme/putative endopeptidase
MRRLISPTSLLTLSMVACTTATTTAPKPTETPAALTGKGVDETLIDAATPACEDFYQYACGNWLKTATIPADRPIWSRSFSVIHDRNEELLRDILQDAAAGKLPQGTPYARELGDFWTTCMDTAAIDAAGLKPLEGEFARLSKVKDAASLEQAVAHLHTLGVRALFRFDSTQDFQDATQVIGEFDQGGLGLPDRDYYLGEEPRLVKIREQYVAHIAAMLQLAGTPQAEAGVKAQTAMRVETELAKVSMTKVDRRDPRNRDHKTDVAGLAKQSPGLGWSAYLADIGHADVNTLNVTAPKFFARLTELAKEIGPSDWQTYLRWRLIDSTAALLSKPLVDEDFHMQQVFTGATELPDRWKRCVTGADRGLGFALARVFVDRHFGQEGKARTVAMVTAIEKSFGDNLATLDWMDEATKGKAREKLGTIQNKIGFPQVWREYGGLQIGRDSYLANALSARAFGVEYELKKIGKPLDRTEWQMTPPTVNAYYEASMNEMVFPAGILQPPFFGLDSAEHVNFGGVGMVMGHELTHGFDDQGRRFDAKGNLTDWWSPEAGKAFDAKADCVVQQYSDFVVAQDAHINGKLTLGENLADLGGLKLSYRAMEAEVGSAAGKKRGQFTPEQEFFLGYAQAWCMKAREPYLVNMTKTDPHSFARYRVLGPLSNMPEFQQAFSCPAGAKMVRPAEKRCQVW